MRPARLLSLILILAPTTALAQQASTEPAPPAAAPAPKQTAPPAPAAPAPAVAPAPTPPAAAPAPTPIPAAAPAVAPKAAPVAPAPAAVGGATPAAAAKKPVDAELSNAAERLLGALTARDLDTIASYCRAPFFFEGKQVTSDAEVRKRWEAELGTEGLELERLPLSGIEYFTFDEMVARFGKAPDKLAGWPMRSGTLAVGNLGGHAVIVLWRKGARGWEALGFHD